jgi:hypothetical protein
MYKSFVLKHVVEPPKLLFASFNATIISLTIWVCSSFIGLVLLMPVFYCLAITTALFLIIHGCMIFLSSKDPYFINTLIAKLRCRKTKNILQGKDNVYGS